jgi:hypothetical protein
MKIEKVAVIGVINGEETPLYHIGNFIENQDGISAYLPDNDIKRLFESKSLGIILLYLGYQHYLFTYERYIFDETTPVAIKEKFHKHNMLIGSIVKKWFESEGCLRIDLFPLFLEFGWYDECEGDDENKKGFRYANQNNTARLIYQEPVFLIDSPILIKVEYFEDLVKDLLEIGNKVLESNDDH